MNSVRLHKSVAVILAMCTFLLLCAFVSFSPSDTTFFFTSTEIHSAYHNLLARPGAELVAWLFYFFGGTAIIFVMLGVSVALRQWQYQYEGVSWGMRESVLVALVGIGSLLQAVFQVELFKGVVPGGMLGNSGKKLLLRFFDAEIILLVLFFTLWMLATLLFGFACVKPLRKMVRFLQRYVPHIPAGIVKTVQIFYRGITMPVQTIVSLKGHCSDMVRAYLPPFFAATPDPEAVSFEEAVYDIEFWQDFVVEQTQQQAVATVAVEVPAPVMNSEIAVGIAEQIPEVVSMYPEAEPPQPYNKPDLQLFKPHKKFTVDKKDTYEQKERARILEDKLERFGIHGRVVAISSGPVVTLFEYEPDSDIPISKILAREDDLALALQALSLRIIAPIPGRAVVGFEVAHSHRKMVFFADCIMSQAYTETRAKLPLVIGYNTVGSDVVLDLASMPHLLVAGSTGSGKSVALNGMLVSLLCHTTPEEMRLILIDPKRLEFSPYADSPHLLFPIVTDAATAVGVLAWAVKTMEQRYAAMADAGVRTLADYRTQTKEAMPYIVIVIDELADLMMTAGKEVETLIARLAQMARAAGIHLIIATQRPSVDVITGLIKVNFPARIAFKVTSKVDSRTILDGMGAEKLLGKGDLLFLDTQGALHRMHGAYVSDEEILKVVQHIKQQRDVMYEELPTSASGEHDMRGEDEALYQEVVKFVITVDEISISLLQRKFRIGYNRSARIMQLLESQGVIMPSQGGKMRKVIR